MWTKYKINTQCPLSKNVFHRFFQTFFPLYYLVHSHTTLKRRSTSKWVGKGTVSIIITRLDSSTATKTRRRRRRQRGQRAEQNKAKGKKWVQTRTKIWKKGPKNVFGGYFIKKWREETNICLEQIVAYFMRGGGGGEGSGFFSTYIDKSVKI
jgi:hypothetical protein